MIDRPEFKPLGKHAAERLTGVGYMSKSMAEQVNNQKKTINDLLDLVDDLLPVLKIDKAREERVRGDAVSLAADLKGMIPEAGR